MRLLGIDIGEHEVRVARADRFLGVVRVIGIERIPLPSSDALPAVLSELAGGRPAAVFTALPAASVTHRILVLPFRDRRRLARTAPLELLGQLPADVADATVAVEPLGPAPGGSTVLAVVARRADLEALAAPLAAAGLGPARIDLAPLPALNLLPAGDEDLALLLADATRSALAVRRGGRLAGLRALGAAADDPAALAAEVRWSLAALGPPPTRLVVGGPAAGPALVAALAAATRTRVEPLAAAVAVPAATDPDALAACAVALGLVAGAARRMRIGIDLGGERRAPGSLRRSAALALLALACGALDLGLVHHGLVRRDAALARAVAAEASVALPGVRLRAPRAQLEAAVAAAAGRRDRLGAAPVLEVLRELSGRVPPALALDLDELAIEPDGVLLHGRTESFDAVEALRRALASSPLLGEVTPEETRTTVDGRRVEFRLRAARRRVAGASS